MEHLKSLFTCLAKVTKKGKESQERPANSNTNRSEHTSQPVVTTPTVLITAGVVPNATIGPSSPSNIPESSERQERYGLFRMDSGDSQALPGSGSKTYPIDIVALHGITGDAYDTWRHDNGIIWLKDILPEDFPGARVFSYGYDAGVFFSLGTGGIDEFARTLLEFLKQSRHGEANKLSQLITHNYSLLKRRKLEKLSLFVTAWGGLLSKRYVVTTSLTQLLLIDRML